MPETRLYADCWFAVMQSFSKVYVITIIEWWWIQAMVERVGANSFIAKFNPDEFVQRLKLRYNLTKRDINDC